MSLNFFLSKKNFILFFILFSLTSFELLAANRYWVAADDGTTKYFHNTANWSASKNSTTGGASVPGKNDVAIFGQSGSSSDVNCVIQRRAVLKQLKIKNNYNGTVSINDNKTVRINEHLAIYEGTLLLGTDSQLFTNKATSYIYSGGTLSAANAKKVQFFAVLDIQSGGTFIAPAKDTIFKGGFRNYGTFTHSSGTVTFSPIDSSYQVVTSGTGVGKDFYNVKKTGKNKTIKMNGDMQVNDITLGGGILNVHGNDLYVKGNYIAHGSNRREVTNTNASTSVIFNGSGDQTIIAHHSNTWPSFENLTINNTSGVVSFSTRAIDIDKTLTINSSATLDINGIDTEAVTLVNNGTLRLQGGETVAITTKDTDSGTITYDGSGTYTDLEYGDNYYNLTFNGTGTYTLDANLNVDGALTITDGTLDVSSDNRSINVAGNWTNSDIFKSRSGTVTFDERQLLPQVALPMKYKIFIMLF